MSQIRFYRPKMTVSMHAGHVMLPTHFGHDRHTNRRPTHISISRKISIEHPSVVLTSLAQLPCSWVISWLKRLSIVIIRWWDMLYWAHHQMKVFNSDSHHNNKTQQQNPTESGQTQHINKTLGRARDRTLTALG